ncbi:cytochrome c [Chitinivorax sp. B]|uniref:c-type cytochrome n=1 Tax=Chitinivorax sp. B TaxID=2502235 RepID=UPI002016A8D7|nr:cytochrome c [Chitinivorax sp. B]
MLLLSLALVSPSPGAPLSSQRQSQLLHLLKQDCGACHGMTRKGGLGPPLTAHALNDKPTDSLVATILYGRPGTAMPPWQAFVTEAEALWLIQWISNESGNDPPVSR